MTRVLALLAGLLLAPPLASVASAHSGGMVMDLRPQASVSILTGLPEARGFGGVELHVAASLFGVGLTTSFGWERTLDDVDGGYFASTLEFRPLTWTRGRPFREVDLNVGLGGLLGGLEGPEFHGALLATLGVDVALCNFTETQQVALFVQYRVSLVQRPDEANMHVLMVGLGYRAAD